MKQKKKELIVLAVCFCALVGLYTVTDDPGDYEFNHNLSGHHLYWK